MPPITPRLPSQRTISISLIFVVLFYVAYIVVTGHDALLGALGRLQTSDWLIILCCSLVNYLLRFSRWHFYLQRLGYQVAVFPSLAYYIAGFCLTTTPGKAGETIRSLYLHQHGVKFSASLAAFFSERFLDVIVVAGLASLSLLQFVEYRSVISGFIIILFLLLVLFAYGNSHRLIEKYLEHIQVKILKRILEWLFFFLRHTRQLFAFRSMLLALLLGNIAWLIQGVAFLYLLQLFSVEMNAWVALGIFAASLLAGAISFIPGGVGTTEAAMAFLLIASGVEQQTALVIPIITRIASLWFAVSLGSLATLLLSLSGIKLHSPEKH